MGGSSALLGPSFLGREGGGNSHPGQGAAILGALEALGALGALGVRGRQIDN